MPSPVSAEASATIASAASFILAATDASGAILQHTDATRVDPYLASYAAMGLARAGSVTCDRATLDAAWAYVGWYATAMDGDGFVSDQVVGPTGPRPVGERDSTDAYAGMFLVALAEVHRAEPSLERLAPLRSAVDRARSAIRATTWGDGLSRAAPEWPVAYLMDQAEVYGGLRAAEELLAALGDPGGAVSAGAEADRLRDAVDRLWDPATSGYRWAVHEDGVARPVDWSAAYPDVASQAMALAWGLVPDDRAAGLAARVDAALPWRDPSTPGLVEGRLEAVGWWPFAGWSAAGSGDARIAEDSLALETVAVATDRAWPYNVGVAGQLIVAATGGWSPRVARG